MRRRAGKWLWHVWGRLELPTPRALKPGMKKMKAGRMLRSRLPFSMDPLSPRIPCTLRPARPPPCLRLFRGAHSLWASRPWPGALPSLRVPRPLHQVQKDRRQGPRGWVRQLPEAMRSPRVPQALGCARLRTLAKQLPSEMPVLGHHRRPLPAHPRAPRPPGARDPAGYLDLYWDLV